MTKNWVIKPPPPATFLEEHPELPGIVAGLLWNRGLKTQTQIDEFLNPDYEGDLHGPFLFNDMSKAVKIIFDAIAENKTIAVHGDYDADGVEAAVIILTTLKKLGAQKTMVFLPHREIDGYGINIRTVKYLKDQKVDLIISCDCGISNVEEIKLAKELGMQVIVTDHHSMPLTLPMADAIIHPLIPGEKYPDKTLAGGGVAFKLVQALLKTHKEKQPVLSDGQTHESFEKWLLDMVAISTVADMVPLLGESRTLTRYGLTVLNKTRNFGLRQLLRNAGLLDEKDKLKRPIDTHTIGFQIAPRINAAGRMDHANTAFALLMSQNTWDAKALANILEKNNSDRQKLTEKLVNQANQQIKETKQENSPIIFVYGEDWSTGILGLLAGKLKEAYYKPVIAMGLNKGEIAGSGRSVPGFNLIESLKTMPELLNKFGGHPQACGFGVKDGKLEEFKTALLNKAGADLANVDLTPQIEIDAQVNLEDVNWKLYDLLQKFEPFGMGNNEPIYAAKNLTITGLSPVGADGKHLRLMVKHNSHIVRKTIAFGFGDPAKHPSDWKANLKAGDKIDLAFTVGVNEWNGTRELQLEVCDIKKSALT